MSYVIQNFSKLNQLFAVTPRVRIIISLKWINFFLFFFKFNRFLIWPAYLHSFYLFFFSKGLFLFFQRLVINLTANYSNKLTLSGIFWNFKFLENFLNKNRIYKNPIKCNNYFLYNLYFLSVKIINIKVTKTFFKNFFFFTIIFFSELWYQFHNNIRFYLNFFFIKNNLKFYKFYNGYFLRVYNF